MVVGSFADIVFETSRERVRSFEGLEHEGGARIAETAIVGREPIVEWLGPAGETASLTLRLAAALGVNPSEDRDRLQYLCRFGKAGSLVIGGRPFGGPLSLWLIEGLSESYSHFSGSGVPQWIDVQVSFRRYKAGTWPPMPPAAVIAPARTLLASVGVEPAKVQEVGEELGDISVANEASLPAVTAVYAEVKSKGTFELPDLQKLVDEKIPIVGELCSKLDIDEGRLIDMMEKGDIEFAKFDRAIKGLSGKYNHYAGTLARAKGKVNSLKATANGLRNARGISGLRAAGGIITELRSFRSW
jgi:phage protein U